ncbi:hypothetical protein T07_3268 [Trichinella nelsoni]|uniref:Uncharacterized protein n=1 Tax=Trichinella nelsoni TaxID=6336 RepID=A0A0V0SBC3_9BILA|nr:hypothetical protein T07_3268 [Trichinella nelsoni]
MDYVIRKFLFSRSRCHSQIVSYGSDVFSCHARRIVFNVLERNCEDEPHLNYGIFILNSSLIVVEIAKVLVRSIKKNRTKNKDIENIVENQEETIQKFRKK